MTRYAAKRVVGGLVLLWVASVVIFLAVQALPGNAATVAAGRGASPTLVALFRREMGLNSSLFVQYGDWLGNILSGHLGTSFATQGPISGLLSDKVRNSVVLAGLTTWVLFPLAFVLGTVMAARRGSWLDRLLTVGTLSFMATPAFVVGALLIAAIGTGLDWFPPVSIVAANQSVWSQLNLFILPGLTLVFAGLAQLTRLVRATMVSVMDAEFVQLARLKGMSSTRVYVRHVLPNAIGPIIQLCALYIGWLLAGQVVVETLFQFPGIGSTLADSVNTRDVPVIEDVAVALTAIYIVLNMAADLLAAYLNPRMRVRRG